MPQGKRWNRTRFTEKDEVSKSFYNQPAYVFEIGDREEGGALLVNGIEVNKKGQGAQNQDQLDLLIERAAQESPLTIPSIRELNERNPNLTEKEIKGITQEAKSWERSRGSQLEASSHIHPWTYGEDIGVLEIASIKGWKGLYMYPWNYGVGKRNQNPQWLTDMSKKFNAALRHSVGCVMKYDDI